jgi:hypothetical protein
MSLKMIGSSPRRLDAVAQPTGDVTSWDTFFAPDDDIHGVIVAGLTQAAQKRAECHSSQYGFTDQDIADLFVRLGKNAHSRFLFDKTQEAGTKERPIVQAMLKQIGAAQWAIGTSKKAHQILHTKAIAVLFADGTGWSVTGSFNLSASAEQQFNIVDVVGSRSRAELFASRIDGMFNWVKTNQPQNLP